MTSVAKLNYQRKQAGLPLIRFDLRKLKSEDIQDLRDAYAAMYEISEQAIGDKRGYIALARGHGYDQDLCHTDSRIFLTWHRAYIYAFEKALNTALQWKRSDQELELTLPYWDWTTYDSNTDASSGIPEVLDAQTYTDAQGQTQDNPLAHGPSIWRTISQGWTGNQSVTHRYPTDLRANIPNLKNNVETYLSNPSFVSFSDDFNFGAHGWVHGLTGGNPTPPNFGDMARIVSAAYDPIFWLHHCMVDRVWFDWQIKHPDAAIPNHVLNTPVYGGDLGSKYIDAETGLMYIYSSDSVDAATETIGTLNDRSAIDDASTAPVPSPKVVEVGTVTGPFDRAQLDFTQLKPPVNTYYIRAYIDNPAADEKTGLNDPSYIGQLALLGHGNCHGASGHCNPDLALRDKYDIRPKHHFRSQKTRFVMDITRGLRRYMASKSSVGNIKIYLVTLDNNGKQVASGSVKYRGCSLRTMG